MKENVEKMSAFKLPSLRNRGTNIYHRNFGPAQRESIPGANRNGADE